MSESQGTRLLLLVTLAFVVVSLTQLSMRYHVPYPPMVTSLKTPKTELVDVAGIAMGFRRLAADMAWIQTLQYYGTPETNQSEREFENGIGKYPDFLTYCQRVTDLDPYFTYVYYYGGAVLGWNLNRLSEAEELLKAGIQRNPQDWRLPQYLAALAYEKNHNIQGMITFLEAITTDPKCPLLMKGLLANLYKKTHRYDNALRLWDDLYKTGDPLYMSRAIEQTKEIYKLKHSHPH